MKSYFCSADLHESRQALFLGDFVDRGDQQNIAFLNEYIGSEKELKKVLDWFMTLPLWLDLPEGLRLIHACWHKPSIECLEPLLKGRELKLPPDISFEDKDGTHRTEMRIKWWQHKPSTRWSGESRLVRDNFVSVTNMRPEA